MTRLVTATTSERDWSPVRFGAWFRDAYRDGRVIDLAATIAATEDVMWWSGTLLCDAGHRIAVTAAPTISGGSRIPAGVYVHTGAIRDGMPRPLSATSAPTLPASTSAGVLPRKHRKRSGQSMICLRRPRTR